MRSWRLTTDHFPKRCRQNAADLQAIRQIEVGLGACQIERNHHQLFQSLGPRSTGLGGNVTSTGGAGWRLLK